MKKAVIIPLWPRQDKEEELAKLAESITKNENTLILKQTERYEKRMKEMLLRRIYHVANGTSILFKELPLTLNEFTNKNNCKSFRQGAGRLRAVNILEVYSRLQQYFITNGFKCKVWSTREKGDRGAVYKRIYISILGVTSQGEQLNDHQAGDRDNKTNTG